MAFTLDDLLNGVRASRKHFLKHLQGLNADQWDWKPYAECKTIRETLAHLIVDDRAALSALQTGKDPDYDAFQESERDTARLLTLLNETHEALLTYLQTNFAEAPLDTEISAFGTKMKLASGIPIFSSEDYYHAGQVAFIRQATDPEWDYYAAIYGGE